MANRKNTAGAKLKLSDEQIQTIIKFLMNDISHFKSDNVKMTNNEKIEAAAKLFEVHPQMIIDLTKGNGRFKNLLHTDNHKLLVDQFKKVSKKVSKKDKEPSKIFNNRKKVIFTSKQMDEIMGLVELGFDLESIANSYNCSTTTIFRNVSKHPNYVAKKSGKKKKNSSTKIVQTITQERVYEQSEDINKILNQKIDILLKRVLVNPELYAETINTINTEFSMLTNQLMSEHEFNSIVVYRVFIILQRILNISAREMQTVFSKVMGV